MTAWKGALNLARMIDEERDDALIDQREAARRMGCGLYSIHWLIRRGELRAFRINGMLRISPLDLRRYLQQHVAGSEPGVFRGRPKRREST
jgi:hypothetical protein